MHTSNTSRCEGLSDPGLSGLQREQVRVGRPAAPERLSAEERALWERLTFSRRPGWFAGAEEILESYVTTALQVQQIALRKAEPASARHTIAIRDLVNALASQSAVNPRPLGTPSQRRPSRRRP